MRLLLLLAGSLCALPLQAASELFKDASGDIRRDDMALKCLDILSVKVTTPNRKVFTFEVKTRAEINVPGNKCYFVAAFNLDGDTQTGTSAWTYGQDFCAFIYLEGNRAQPPRTQGAGAVMSAVQIDKNTLRFTLTSDRVLKDHLTFNVRTVIREAPPDDPGVAYTVLDGSAPSASASHRFDL